VWLRLNQVQGHSLLQAFLFRRIRWMKRYDRMSSLAWLAFAIYICIASSRLSFGSFDRPGPGFLPLLVGILLGVFSIIAFLQASLSSGRQEEVASWHPGEKWKKLVLVLVVLFAFSFFLEILGFLVCTFILLILLFRFGSESKKWPAAIAGSAVASLGSYAIFELWLQTQLPKGILGF
jgi:putative tricarboxylic transport membrane protein